MHRNQLEKSANQAHSLNQATEDLIKSIHRKDSRFRTFFIISWTILLIVGIFGIYKQNEIANANKQHLDCIVKYFTTEHRTPNTTISNVDTTCNIERNS